MCAENNAINSFWTFCRPDFAGRGDEKTVITAGEKTFRLQSKKVNVRKEKEKKTKTTTTTVRRAVSIFYPPDSRSARVDTSRAVRTLSNDE